MRLNEEQSRVPRLLRAEIRIPVAPLFPNAKSPFSRAQYLQSTLIARARGLFVRVGWQESPHSGQGKIPYR